MTLQERYYNATQREFAIAMTDRWTAEDYRMDREVKQEIAECERLAKEQGVELQAFKPW